MNKYVLYNLREKQTANAPRFLSFMKKIKAILAESCEGIFPGLCLSLNLHLHCPYGSVKRPSFIFRENKYVGIKYVRTRN